MIDRTLRRYEKYKSGKSVPYFSCLNIFYAFSQLELCIYQQTFQMTSAFSPDGSEPLGRTLRSDRLRQESEDIKDFYQLDSVVEFLTGFEGRKFTLDC